MSRIEEMIERLCPDGVEFKPLGEVASAVRGVRVTRKQLSASGSFPVFQNSLQPLGYFDKANFPANTTFIIGAGAAGQIGYSDTDYWGADDCYSVVCSELLNGRFVYHCLLNMQPYLLSRVRKASIPRLSRSAIEKSAFLFRQWRSSRKLYAC